MKLLKLSEQNSETPIIEKNGFRFNLQNIKPKPLKSETVINHHMTSVTTNQYHMADATDSTQLFHRTQALSLSRQKRNAQNSVMLSNTTPRTHGPLVEEEVSSISRPAAIS